MEDCRAWTKEPILRPIQIQLVALTLLRLLQAHLNHAWGRGSWWLKPEWHPRGSAMPRSSTAAVCSGGTVRNLRNARWHWRSWKIALKPLASAALLQGEQLKILETTT
jgi:hypothetical protein